MNSYAENLRRSIVNATRRFKEMTDELKAKQEVNEWYSTEQVQNMVDFLRRSANENGGLDVGDYWALCEEAADMIESMLHYEQSHGLRKTLEESE
jgi:hypothetical protein